MLIGNHQKVLIEKLVWICRNGYFRLDGVSGVIFDMADALEHL